MNTSNQYFEKSTYSDLTKDNIIIYKNEEGELLKGKVLDTKTGFDKMDYYTKDTNGNKVHLKCDFEKTIVTVQNKYGTQTIEDGFIWKKK